jgi:hypothetical protein
VVKRKKKRKNLAGGGTLDERGSGVSTPTPG